MEASPPQQPAAPQIKSRPAAIRFLATPADAPAKTAKALSVAVLPLRVSAKYAALQEVDLERAYSKLIHVLNRDENIRVIDPSCLHNHSTFRDPPSMVLLADARRLRAEFAADVVVFGAFRDEPNPGAHYDLEIRVQAYLTALSVSFTAQRSRPLKDFATVDIGGDMAEVFAEIRRKISYDALAKLEEAGVAPMYAAPPR